MQTCGKPHPAQTMNPVPNRELSGPGLFQETIKPGPITQVSFHRSSPKQIRRGPDARTVVTDVVAVGPQNEERLDYALNWLKSAKGYR
jgi:hypothetical protein